MLGLIQNGVEAYTPHTLKRTHVQVRAYIHHAAVMCTLYIHHLHMPVTTCSWYGMFDWIWIFRVVRSLLMVSCICRKNTRRNSIDFISLCESGCEWNANQMAIFRYLHFRLADIVFTLQNTKKRNRKCKRRTLKLMDFGDCVLLTQNKFTFPHRLVVMAMYCIRMEEIQEHNISKFSAKITLQKVSSCGCKIFYDVVCLCTVRVILSVWVNMIIFSRKWIVNSLQFELFICESIITVKYWYPLTKTEQTCAKWISKPIRFLKCVHWIHTLCLKLKWKWAELSVIKIRFKVSQLHRMCGN